MFKDLILCVCVCVCVFSPYAECVPHGLESYPRMHLRFHWTLSFLLRFKIKKNPCDLKTFPLIEKHTVFDG